MDNKEEISVNELLERFIKDNAKLNIGDEVKVVFGTNDCNNSYYFSVINRRYVPSIDDIVYDLMYIGVYCITHLITIKESDMTFKNGVCFANFEL